MGETPPLWPINCWVATDCRWFDESTSTTVTWGSTWNHLRPSPLFSEASTTLATSLLLHPFYFRPGHLELVHRSSWNKWWWGETKWLARWDCHQPLDKYRQLQTSEAVDGCCWLVMLAVKDFVGTWNMALLLSRFLALGFFSILHWSSELIFQFFSNTYGLYL